jgi:hypothetical protein
MTDPTTDAPTCGHRPAPAGIPGNECTLEPGHRGGHYDAVCRTDWPADPVPADAGTDTPTPTGEASAQVTPASGGDTGADAGPAPEYADDCLRTGAEVRARGETGCCRWYGYPAAAHPGDTPSAPDCDQPPAPEPAGGPGEVDR